MEKKEIYSRVRARGNRGTMTRTWIWFGCNWIVEGFDTFRSLEELNRRFATWTFFNKAL